MRQIILLTLILSTCSTAISQTRMYIHKTDGSVDSLWLNQIRDISFRAAELPIPTDELVAFYPFNGNAMDESPNTSDGVALGATLAADRFGDSSSAYYFDGVTASIAVPETTYLNQLTGEMTVALWVKAVPFTSPGYSSGILLSKRDYTKAQYPIHFNLQLDVNSLVFFAQTGDDTYQQYRPTQDIYSLFADSAWHHIVIMHEYGTLSNTKIYVDGINHPGYWMCTYPSSPVAGPAKVGASYLMIGKQNISGGEYCFKGTLDDIRFYKRLLSEQEILALYFSQE